MQPQNESILPSVFAYFLGDAKSRGRPAWGRQRYVYIYLSNENPTLADVYFDDVKITHTKTPVLQYNEYYPFGLQTANGIIIMSERGKLNWFI